jgi:hypothetical protein
MITTGKCPSFWNAVTIISSESSCFTFLQLSASDHLFWRSQEVRFSRIAKGGIRSLSHPNRGTSLKPLTRGGGFRRTATSARGVPGFKPYTLHFSITKPRILRHTSVSHTRSFRPFSYRTFVIRLCPLLFSPLATLLAWTESPTFHRVSRAVFQRSDAVCIRHSYPSISIPQTNRTGWYDKNLLHLDA